MSTKYRMRKLSVAIKKSGAHFFMGVCGAYNNVHKLSIHFIALSVNLVPLFHHLPHIYSPFAIHTNSHSSFNPFFGPDLQLVLSRAFFSLTTVRFELKLAPSSIYVHSAYLQKFECFCIGFEMLALRGYGMMMEMQMRWHNHSNLIHSIDFE